VSRAYLGEVPVEAALDKDEISICGEELELVRLDSNVAVRGGIHRGALPVVGPLRFRIAIERYDVSYCVHKSRGNAEKPLAAYPTHARYVAVCCAVIPVPTFRV
jgi:hypothetical protein